MCVWVEHGNKKKSVDWARFLTSSRCRIRLGLPGDSALLLGVGGDLEMLRCLSLLSRLGGKAGSNVGGDLQGQQEKTNE